MRTAVLALAVAALAAALAASLYPLTPPAPPSESTPPSPLIRWFLASGGFLHPSVAPLASPSSGQGLHASAPLSASEVFLRTPLSLCINIEHAAASPLMQLDRAPWWPDVDALAVFVLAERGRAGSRWAPYLRSLPFGEVRTPLTCPAKALDALEASPLAPFARRQRRKMAEMRDRVARELRGLDVPLEQYAGAVALVRSRLHRVRVRDGEGEWHDTRSLVPVADLLNFGDGPSAECYTDAGSRHFECRTTRAVAAGEQLLVAYAGAGGAAPANSLLAMDYGFALENNRADAVSVELPESADDGDGDEATGRTEPPQDGVRQRRWAPLEVRRHRAAVLERNGLAAVRFAELTWDAPLPPPAMAKVRALALGPAEFELAEREGMLLWPDGPAPDPERAAAAEARARAVIDDHVAGDATLPEAEIRALGVMRESVRRQLSLYATPLDADTDEGLDADERLMRLVRVGEKRLLHHWERELRVQVGRLYPKDL